MKMKKKKTILLGIIIVILSLFVNLVISKEENEGDLTISNVEALAQKEGDNPSFVVDCDDVGVICFGVDRNGVKGKHSGLNIIH